MKISRGGFTERQHLIVKVTTNCGLYGLGEGVGDPIVVQNLIEKHFPVLLTGEDPRNISKIRSILIESQTYFERKGSYFAALSALEMACWDIKGKDLQVPVYELLGGKLRDQLDVYASNLYWETNLDSLQKQAKKICDLGIQHLKVHIGVVPPKDELIRLDALAEVIGDRYLMIDLNAGYDVLHAKLISQYWKDYRIFWIEEPISPNYISQLKELRNSINIPIAMGENEFRIFGFRELLESQACDVLMPDIGRVGGLEETRQICALAHAFGVPVSPHNFASGILLAATIHLMAATENTQLLEYDNSENSIYKELLTFDLAIKDGILEIPDVVGLGVDLPEEILTKYGNY